MTTTHPATARSIRHRADARAARRCRGLTRTASRVCHRALPMEVRLVWQWTRHRIDTSCPDGTGSTRGVSPGHGRDRGDILQTVIITAALAAAAIVIVAIIVAKARSAANNIKTQ